MNRSGQVVACLSFLILGNFVAANPDNGEKLASAQEAVSQPTIKELGEILRPRPDLTPADVVRIQLKSLQQNDIHNRGIAHCFEFASPTNRATTGPLEKFILMLHLTPYDVMLNHRVALVGKVRRKADHAEVLVSLADSQKKLAVFVFVLSKQNQAPYEGCWMTVSVDRLPVSNRPEPWPERKR